MTLSIAREFQSTRPRGTRPPAALRSSRPRSFNPRVRAGRDRATFVFLLLISWFQSTRPRGTRPLPSNLLILTACFNPRVRAGRDIIHSSTRFPSECFNPRVRAGRDRWSLNVSIWSDPFQSTRPRGTRPGAPCCRDGRRCFNPRVRAGRDRPSPSI